MSKNKSFTPDQELEVCETYERIERAKPVAEMYGVNPQTIYRVLKKHGVPRTHRHPKPEPKKRSRNVTLDVEEAAKLYRDGQTLQQIGSHFGCSWMTVRRRLVGNGIELRKSGPVATKDAEQICSLYNHGVTNAEIAKRFNINPATVTEIARRGGCNLRGRGSNSKAGGLAASRITAERMHEKFVKRFDSVSDKVEIVISKDRYHTTVRCVTCGSEFNWYKRYWTMDCPCPECRRNQRAIEFERERKRKKYERQQQSEAAFEWRESVPRICKHCGEPFYSGYETTVYCSDWCRHKAKVRRSNASAKRRGTKRSHQEYKSRMRIAITPATYDRTVTLDAVYKKYHGICCECGCKTVRSKGYRPNQATLDHVIALANNGTHTWDNVQLLCSTCNSKKRDLGQMRLAV